MKFEKGDDKNLARWKHHVAILEQLKASDGYDILQQYFSIHRERAITEMIILSKSPATKQLAADMIFFLNGFEQSIKIIDHTIKTLEEKIADYEETEEEEHGPDEQQ